MLTLCPPTRISPFPINTSSPATQNTTRGPGRSSASQHPRHHIGDAFRVQQGARSLRHPDFVVFDVGAGTVRTEATGVVLGASSERQRRKDRRPVRQSCGLWCHLHRPGAVLETLQRCPRSYPMALEAVDSAGALPTPEPLTSAPPADAMPPTSTPNAIGGLIPISHRPGNPISVPIAHSRQREREEPFGPLVGVGYPSP
jgi:hypothetical protein